MNPDKLDDGGISTGAHNHPAHAGDMARVPAIRPGMSKEPGCVSCEASAIPVFLDTVPLAESGPAQHASPVEIPRRSSEA